MNQISARVLRRYARACIPEVVARRYPKMADRLYQLLKDRWNATNHADRSVLRRHVKLNRPLPEDLKAEARRRGLVVEWPPRMGGRDAGC
jgi:hypothetical protein